MRIHAAGLIAICAIASGCSVESNVDRIYSMEIDEKATSPELDRIIEADRQLPHLDLGPGMMGMNGPRMISIDPVGDMREGLMVTLDGRTHSRDVQDRLKAVPGVLVTRKMEVGDDEGGEEMLKSVSMHRVMLARVRFDCRRNLVTHLSYHTADTFAAPFARTFEVPSPRERQLAGPMRQAACTGAPEGIAMKPPAAT